MPDPVVMPPYLDPSEYPDYIDMLKKQMASQAIMGAFQQSNSTPQDWNSMRVIPRRSPLQNVASIATALMAPTAMKGALNAQMKYYGGLYGAPQGSAPAPAAPTPTPSAPVVGAFSPNPSSIPASTPATPPAGNSMVPAGTDPRRAQMLLQMLGPQGYAQLLAKQIPGAAPITSALIAAGIDPNSPEGRGLAQRALSKSTMNLQPVRPGTALYDVNTGGMAAFNPSVPQGAVPSFQGGVPTGVSEVPGALSSIAAQEGAQTAGRVANTPTNIPTQGGGSRFGYPGDIIGVPPALRGPESPAASAPPRGTSGPSSSPLTGAWATMPKLTIPQGVGDANEFVKGQLQAAASKDAELSTQYGHEADLAGQQLEWNREARQALPTAEVGPMSDWLTKSRAWLTEAGVPEKLIPSDGSVTPTMELNKALKNAALQGARSLYGPRMSQMEVKLQSEEMSPSSQMTRDAIASLMRQNDVRNLYGQARAQDYGLYMQRGGNPLRFESWYATNFPITGFAQAAAMSPQELQALAKQRGLTQ